MNKFTAISLGWGVQSFALAAMVALGDLPMVDAVIHSDTTHEGEGTYAFARKYTPWLEERGVKVVTVSQPEQAAKVTTDKTDIPAFSAVVDLPNGKQEVTIPAHTSTERGGMLRRQCTQRWKIAPIRRWLQANRNGLQVETWLGISLDEVQRMGPSDVKYIVNRWPLIEKRMSRHDCTLYLERHGIEIPPKSACVFCPFHSRNRWREMKLENGADWQKAIEVDEAIRKVRPPFDLFVHPDRIPLAEVDVSNEVDNGQLSLFDDECFGVCGV
jgi:hypothetical protein